MATATTAAPAAKTKPAAKKAAPAKPKTNEIGILACILECLQRKEGATVREIHAELKKRFPERRPEGMLASIRIQIHRMPKQRGFELKRLKQDKERGGLVYKAPARIPAKGSSTAE